LKWLGLTGGIATGKSTVTDYLKQRGVPVVDADRISHDLCHIGAPGYEKIVSTFGVSILNADETLNRKVLGEIIFNDSQARVTLESILHPMIQNEVQIQKVLHQKAGHSICFYDVPLLFEKNMTDQFDKTVLVFAPLLQQIQRLMKRNQFTHSEAMMRLKSQLTIYDKIKHADYCIDNSTTLQDLFQQIDYLLNSLNYKVIIK